MLKLCENNTIVTVYPYVDMQTDNGFGPFRFINPDVLLKNKFEWILYNNDDDIYSLPINRTILSMIKDINLIEFEFVKCIPDTPPDKDNSILKFEIDGISSILNTMIEYYRYQLIQYLPYSDFALDHMPTIETVYINGEPSTLFNDIAKYINEEFDSISAIMITKKFQYKYIDNLESIHASDMNMIYIRNNSSSPLFNKILKNMYKCLRKIDHIEINLRWYDNSHKDYLTKYTESTADDFMYSSPGIQEILTLSTVYVYLIKYYNTELKYMKNNNFLVISVIGYIKLKGITYGVQSIATDNERANNYDITNLLYRAYKYLY